MPVTLEKSNVGRHLLAARCRLLLSQAVRHPDQCYVLLRPAKASAFQGGDCDANIVACSCGLILFANLGATHAAPLSHECQITRWRKVAQLVKRCRPSFQLLQRATCPPALMLARRGRQTKDVERRRNVRSGSKTEVSGLARHVRFTLRSRHRQPASACQFGAKAQSRCAPARCAGARTERPEAS